MEGKTALGASSPANPALHRPEPLSTTKAVTSSSHILRWSCLERSDGRLEEVRANASSELFLALNTHSPISLYGHSILTSYFYSLKQWYFSNCTAKRGDTKVCVCECACVRVCVCACVIHLFLPNL